MSGDYALSMRRQNAALDTALRRMLDADDAENTTHSNDDWAAWQQAAADYWVLRHPDLARLRRGEATRTPSIAEMRERAELLSRAMDGVPDTWRLAPPSVEKAEHLARVGWFHELIAGLYDPIHSAMGRAGGDRQAVETLVRFLESDIYCFRSGYVKADAIRALGRADLDDPMVRRLRAVVLEIVDSYDRREFRAYVRLALRVDGEELRTALKERLASPSRRVARHARWVLEGLGDEAVRR
jgi:hypothetical protein